MAAIFWLRWLVTANSRIEAQAGRAIQKNVRDAECPVSGSGAALDAAAARRGVRRAVAAQRTTNTTYAQDQLSDWLRVPSHGSNSTGYVIRASIEPAFDSA